MKLSFSTLTCPEWSFHEIYAAAADLGYDGIEIRGIADEMYAPRIAAFQDNKIQTTRARLSGCGLEIPILTSGAYLLGNTDLDAVAKEITEYAALAQKLGVPYVRLLIEETPQPALADPDIDYAVAAFDRMCRLVEPYGVTLLTETNGFLADTRVCRTFMERIEAPNKGLIWDVHHPYRYFNESPATTLLNVGSYIKHVHVKDSVKGTNGKITYMLNGYGDIPFDEIVDGLRKIGYDGYLSYEWVKRWSRELAEPSITLFSYINHMKSLLLS